jgi:hypothetical protein
MVSVELPPAARAAVFRADARVELVRVTADTCPVLLDVARRVAAVSIDLVVVVALLARLDNAVTALKTKPDIPTEEFAAHRIDTAVLRGVTLTTWTLVGPHSAGDVTRWLLRTSARSTLKRVGQEAPVAVGHGTARDFMQTLARAAIAVVCVAVVALLGTRHESVAAHGAITRCVAKGSATVGVCENSRVGKAVRAARCWADTVSALRTRERAALGFGEPTKLGRATIATSDLGLAPIGTPVAVGVVPVVALLRRLENAVIAHGRDAVGSNERAVAIRARGRAATTTLDAQVAGLEINELVEFNVEPTRLGRDEVDLVKVRHVAVVFGCTRY